MTDSPECEPTTLRCLPDWFVALLSVLLSATLLAVSQTVMRANWCIFFALAPALMVLRPDRFWGTWLSLGAVAGVASALSITWITCTSDGYVWLLPIVAVYTGLYFVLPAAICSWIGCGVSGLLLLPAAWALLEVLGRNILLGVLWPQFGQPLADWPLVAQAAALVGPEFLTYVAVAVNVSVALYLRSTEARVRLWGLVGGPGLLMLLAIGGGVSLWLDGKDRQVDVLRIGVVQPNILQDEKWDPEKRAAALSCMDKLIDRLMDLDPDIVVLPETALTGFIRYEDDLTEWAKAVVTRTKRPLVFGALDRDDQHDAVYNAAMMITPYNSVFSQYKMRLVPITERRLNLGPFDKIVQPAIEKMRGGEETFAAGEAPTTFELADSATFGCLICFEDIFPSLARQHLNSGAQLLLVLINTERFGRSSQPWQHLRRARLSAVSVGAPIVRCSNAGISCLVDRCGRLCDVLQDSHGESIQVQDAKVIAAPLAQRWTPYAWGGDPLAYFVWLAILGLGVAVLRRRGRVMAPTAR